MSSIAEDPGPVLPPNALLFFALLTFGITWSVIGGYIYFPEQAAATFGEISGGHPLYFLATWAPGIAGILLVLAFSGMRGLRSFFSRLFYWRCAPVWCWRRSIRRSINRGLAMRNGQKTGIRPKMARPRQTSAEYWEWHASRAGR